MPLDHAAYKKEWARKWYASGVGKAYWAKYYMDKGKKSRDERRFSNPMKFRIETMFYNAKKRSAKLCIPFSISLMDLVIPSHCPVLGIELKLDNKKRNSGNSPSIDKITPSLGYVPGNVRIISWRANALKSDGTAKEHRLIAAYIERN